MFTISSFKVDLVPVQAFTFDAEATFAAARFSISASGPGVSSISAGVTDAGAFTQTSLDMVGETISIVGAQIPKFEAPDYAPLFG